MKRATRFAQMNWAPIARILLRYGVGYFAGRQVGETLSLDADVVMIVSIGIGCVIEGAYVLAKRRGWAT